MVVLAEIGLGQAHAVELGDVDAQRLGTSGETALVPQDVLDILDILGADVARDHHLVDRASSGRKAEELNEPDESQGLTRNRAPARGQDAEVAK